MSSTEQPPIGESATMPIFVVTAYRHGELNNHTYTVYVGTDRQAAIAEAKEEHHGRGLKYGVKVVEYPSEKTVAYFPTHGEVGPTESAERYAAERIGSSILLAYEAHTRKDHLALLIAGKLGLPEPPEWLKELCETQLALARRMKPDTPRPSIRDE